MTNHMQCYELSGISNIFFISMHFLFDQFILIIKIIRSIYILNFSFNIIFLAVVVCSKSVLFEKVQFEFIFLVRCSRLRSKVNVIVWSNVDFDILVLDILNSRRFPYCYFPQMWTMLTKFLKKNVIDNEAGCQYFERLNIWHVDFNVAVKIQWTYEKLDYFSVWNH
jgi:hypothetical protein